MKTKNNYWIVAGAINLFTFLLHLIGGQLDLINPMINSNLSIEEISQLIGAWHLVTLILLGSSIILLLAGFNKKFNTNLELINIIGYLSLLFCIPFILSSFYYGLLVPQWILFLPIGFFTLLGVSKSKKYTSGD